MTSLVVNRDQAMICAEVLESARKGQWESVVSLTEDTVSLYPDALKLLMARFDALSRLGRLEEAADIGVSVLGRFPQEEALIGKLVVILPHLASIKTTWLPALKKLKSELGQVLYIQALVRTRRGVDALVAFELLGQAFPSQKSLPAKRFASQLSIVDLYPLAEHVLNESLNDDLLSSSALCERVELLLKLAGKQQPERFGEARQLAELLFSLYPDKDCVWYAMGRVWWEASRMDLSLPFLRKFLKENPTHSMRSGVTFASVYDESLSPDEVFQTHESWAQQIMKSVPKNLPGLRNSFEPDRPLRIGYISPDFGYHPVGYFGISTIPEHDSDRYSVYLYSQRDPVTQDDPLSQEFRSAVGEDKWRWIRKLKASELFQRIRDDKIDILIDLTGHTTSNRMEIFAMRTAPVQVSWLGYPHSTGMPTIDYRISDDIVEPVGESEQWSSEEIVRLPNGFHAIRLPEDLPEPKYPPCLENGYLTFGSFNNVNKIGHRTIELWSTLLREIPDSRLMLKHKTMNVFENREGLRSLFAFFGVDPKRIQFLGTTPGRKHHFMMYEQMDIALDPLGYNGTTTTCEALYMGVPVLTLPGRKHASRVSASLLHRVGLDAWVAKDAEQYLKIARYASKNFDLVAKRRARLRSDFHNSPLNDGQALARELEKAYRQMWHRACAKNQSDSTFQ